MSPLGWRSYGEYAPAKNPMDPCRPSDIGSVFPSPFSFPAVAVENDVLAFLESEYGQLALRPERRLRLLRRHPPHLPPRRRRDADRDGARRRRAPRIDGAPVAVSSGRVYVRTSEAARGATASRARAALRRRRDATGIAYSRTSPRTAAMSSTGSVASNLIGPGLDTGGFFDIFVYDRQMGTTCASTRPSVVGAQTGTRPAR